MVTVVVPVSQKNKNLPFRSSQGFSVSSVSVLEEFHCTIQSYNTLGILCVYCVYSSVMLLGYGYACTHRLFVEIYSKWDNKFFFSLLHICTYTRSERAMKIVNIFIFLRWNNIFFMYYSGVFFSNFY